MYCHFYMFCNRCGPRLRANNRNEHIGRHVSTTHFGPHLDHIWTNILTLSTPPWTIINNNNKTFHNHHRHHHLPAHGSSQPWAQIDTPPVFIAKGSIGNSVNTPVVASILPTANVSTFPCSMTFTDTQTPIP